jgi:hypothetical protein
MSRLLLVTAFVLVPLVSDVSAQDSERASERRLHFQLVQDGKVLKVLPVDPSTPLVEGETRISCREIEFVRELDVSAAILVDGRIEFVDSWLEAERIKVERGEHGFSFSGPGLNRQFKTVAAEERERQRQTSREVSRGLDAIDRGLIESEKEHRRIAVQQLRRSFVTGQSQLTSSTPTWQRARWEEKLYNLYPGR